MIEELLDIKEQQLSANEALALTKEIEVGVRQLNDYNDRVQSLEVTLDDLSKVTLDGSYESVETISDIIDSSILKDELLDLSTESISGIISKASVFLVRLYEDIRKMVLNIYTRFRILLLKSPRQNVTPLNHWDSISFTLLPKDTRHFAAFVKTNDIVDYGSSVVISTLVDLFDKAMLNANARGSTGVNKEEFLKGFVLTSTVKGIPLPKNFAHKYVKIASVGNGNFSILGYTIGADDLRQTSVKITDMRVGKTTTMNLNINLPAVTNIITKTPKEVVRELDIIMENYSQMKKYLDKTQITSQVTGNAVLRHTSACMVSVYKLYNNAHAVYDLVALGKPDNT